MRTRLFLFAAMALAVACSVETAPDQPVVSRKMTLTASHEGSDPDTRTYTVSNSIIKWLPQDELSVFSSPGVQSRFVNKESDASTTASFEGDAAPSSNYVAVYPYSEDNRLSAGSGGYDYRVTTRIKQVQWYREDSFGVDSYPTVSCFSGTSFTMYGICGGIRFDLPFDGVKFVVFRSNGGELISGTVTAGLSKDSPEPGDIQIVPSGGSDKVILAPLQTSGTFRSGMWTHYLIVMAPVVLEKGFTLYFVLKDGSVSEVSTSKPYTVKRATFAKLTNLQDKMTPSKTMDPVDLGLSVDWAPCNLGTVDPTDPGVGLTWADPMAYDICFPDWYSWYGGTSDFQYIYDTATQLRLSDDYAYTSLGGNWRTPTKEEFQELVNGCTWVKKTDGGFSGKDPYWVVTSKSNGNSIILPDAPCWTATKGYEWRDGAVRAWREPWYTDYTRPVYARDDFISFKEKGIEKALLAKFDSNGDGKLSKMEAAAVTSLVGVLGTNQDYESFDEYRYFTGLTSVSSLLFYKWKNLKSIKLPPSVSVIESDAFGYCESLTSIEIPSSVRELDGFSHCTGLTEIIVPEGVKEIEGHAFSNCSNLVSVSLPSTLEEIGSGAFDWSYNISKLNVASLESWLKVVLRFHGDGHPFHQSSGHFYVAGKEITSLTIPAGTTEILDGTFFHCRYITSVSFPGSLKSIGQQAFRGCSGLTSYSMKPGVTSIGDSAFEECFELQSIYIPEGVVEIGSGAFASLYEETITLPSSLKSLGRGAFSQCYKVINQVVPSIEWWLKLECDGDAFRGVWGDPRHIFVGSSEVTSLVIPSSISEIRNSAFCNCGFIESVVVQEGVKTIGTDAFYECTSIASLSLPSSLKSIGSCAFQACSGLKTLVIPEGVEEMGSGAFGNCSGLTSIDVRPVTPPAAKDNIFYGLPSDVPIYVPAESVSKYKSADGWNKYASNIKAKP